MEDLGIRQVSPEVVEAAIARWVNFVASFV